MSLRCSTGKPSLAPEKQVPPPAFNVDQVAHAWPRAVAAASWLREFYHLSLASTSESNTEIIAGLQQKCEQPNNIDGFVETTTAPRRSPATARAASAIERLVVFDQAADIRHPARRGRPIGRCV